MKANSRQRKSADFFGQRFYFVGDLGFDFSFAFKVLEFSFLVVITACEKLLSPLFFLFLSTFFIQALNVS